MASETLLDCEELNGYLKYGADTLVPRSKTMTLDLEREAGSVIVDIQPIPSEVMNKLSPKHSAAVYAMRELAGFEHVFKGAKPGE